MACDILTGSELSRFHAEYYSRNRPVVLRGLRERQTLRIFQWSATYFADVLRDAPQLPVLITDTGFLSYERCAIELPYEAFLRRAFEPRSSTPGPAPRYYLKMSTTRLPDGHDDSEAIPELRPYLRKASMKNLWISGAGLTVGLHFDAAENINFQVRGHKRFTLYPPGVDNYYPASLFSQTAHISGVFRHGPEPDLRAFPKFDPTQGQPIELRDGDVLYLPAYWWHQVESLGRENVNLNYWWLPPWRKQLANANQALRGYAQLAMRLARFGNLQQAPRPQRSKSEANASVRADSTARG